MEGAMEWRGIGASAERGRIGRKNNGLSVQLKVNRSDNWATEESEAALYDRYEENSMGEPARSKRGSMR